MISFKINDYNIPDVEITDALTRDQTTDIDVSNLEVMAEIKKQIMKSGMLHCKFKGDGTVFKTIMITSTNVTAADPYQFDCYAFYYTSSIRAIYLRFKVTSGVPQILYRFTDFS